MAVTQGEELKEVALESRLKHHFMGKRKEVPVKMKSHNTHNQTLSTAMRVRLSRCQRSSWSLGSRVSGGRGTAADIWVSPVLSRVILTWLPRQLFSSP